jgi:hypothetical protein
MPGNRLGRNGSPSWREGLPRRYWRQVTPPLRFEHFTEPSVRAGKTLGYGFDGQCCFYRHHFVVVRDLLDEDPIEEETCREEVRAWHLASGEWLQRTVRGGAAGACNDRRLTPVLERVASRPR